MIEYDAMQASLLQASLLQANLALKSELVQTLLLLFATNFAFIALAIWQRHGLEKMHTTWLRMLSFSISAILIWHSLGLAGQVIAQQSTASGLDVLLNWGLVFFAALLAVLGPWVSNYFLQRTVKPYSQ